MFILRTINKEGLEHNACLGESYNYVDRFIHSEEFRRCYKVVFNINHVADLDEMSTDFSKNCIGIVTYNEGANLTPIYKNKQNYIMTESGKTFSCLSK